MKLVSFLDGEQEHLGLQLHDHIYNLRVLHHWMPRTITKFLAKWDYYLPIALEAEMKLKMSPAMQTLGRPVKDTRLLAPVPNPCSLRDGYAFRQHVETARRNRGLPMIDAFDEYPVFYFGNHKTVVGPGEIHCMPDHLKQLDFELEVAVVICRNGKNIRAEDADSYIGGLMILNDFSARQLQMEEMQLSLGPAKGKDFATAIGPWMVTLDELAPFECSPQPGHVGKNWDLHMCARVNGRLMSSGKLSDMHWTFAELIERASYGVTLEPGDIIGSGTVGTGCFLELNGTGKIKDADYTPRWLNTGEIIELEVEGLGVLRNQIALTGDAFSILSLKKETCDS